VVQYSGSNNPRAACPWCRRRRTLRKIGSQCHGVTFQKTWKLNNTAVRTSSRARVKYLRRNGETTVVVVVVVVEVIVVVVIVIVVKAGRYPVPIV